MPEPVADKSAHILVVDDDDRIRTLLKRYLSENGYRTSVASNGKEAQTLLGGVEFDLLILDVMMPGLSGFDLTEKIRAASNVPILLLTARGLPEDRIEGLERGADDYLAKPFEPRELLLRVAALLRRTQPIALDRQELTFGDCTFTPGRGETSSQRRSRETDGGRAGVIARACKKNRANQSHARRWRNRHRRRWNVRWTCRSRDCARRSRMISERQYTSRPCEALAMS